MSAVKSTHSVSSNSYQSTKEQIGTNEIESRPTRRSYPVDGGWGWLVVFASFTSQAVCGGINSSFGILLDEFISYFGTTYARTSLLTSLVPFIALGTGPITGALTNLYGCRIVAIIGLLLAAVGLLLSLVAPNIYFMYFTYGILSGYGMGACYIASIIIVPFYFEQKRSFATGLATCGIGFGTFVFGPLTECLLEYYGNWKSVLLLDAGFVLNCLVLICVFRPVVNSKKLAKHNTSTEVECRTQYTIPKSGSSLPQMSYEPFEENKTVNINKYERDFGSAPLLHVTQKTLTTPVNNFHNRNRKGGSCFEINTEPCLVDTKTKSTGTGDTQSSKGIIWKDILDASILKNPFFLVFGISNFITSISAYPVFVFLPDRAIHLDIPLRRAAFLLSILGVSNMLSRVLFGIIANLKCSNRLVLYATTITMAGFTDIISSLCHSYGLLCLYSAVQGVLSGAAGSLLPIVLIDILGLDNLPSSFGILMLFQGLGAVCGPPFAGWLFDVTQDYDLVFYVIGALGSVSGIVLYSMLMYQCKYRSSERIQTAFGLSTPF